MGAVYELTLHGELAALQVEAIHDLSVKGALRESDWLVEDVEDADLEEDLAEKLEESRQLWARAGNVVVVHAEDEEELYTRRAIISC